MSNLPKDSHFNKGGEGKEKEGEGGVSVFSNYLSCTMWKLGTVY